MRCPRAAQAGRRCTRGARALRGASDPAGVQLGGKILKTVFSYLQVSGVGDLDGDGRADLAVAAPSANLTPTSSGSVYLHAWKTQLVQVGILNAPAAVANFGNMVGRTC